MEEHGIIEPLGDDEEVPQGGRDVTSDYDPSEADTTFGSLTSSVGGHVWEYGRRYHAFREGRYPLPNDDAEQQREGIRHEMLKEIIDEKLYLAPIGDEPQKIIDLGTGFGDWACEIAQIFPGAQVIGVDLSPIQPQWVPPNLEFVVDDIEDEWLHANDFDFAHFRFVNTVLKDNAAALRRVFNNLKPGGWLEIQDILPHVSSDDSSIPPHYPVIRFYSMIKPVLRDRYGLDIRVLDTLPSLLQDLGYVNVQRKVFHVPIGEWAREKRLRRIGLFMRHVLMDLVGAMAARPLVEAGYEREEIEALVQDVAGAVGNRRIHAYLPIHFVWAQKPGA